MKERAASSIDVRDVVMRMRASTAAELFATRPADDSAISRANLADEINAMSPLLLNRWAFDGTDGRPAAIVCAWRLSPGVGLCVMIATEAWPEVARTVYRLIRRVLSHNELPGIHRFETMVFERSDYRWLTRLGFTEQALAARKGKNGENFMRLAWVKREPVHVRY